MDIQTLILLGGFIVVAVAARQLAGFFARFKLPLITGLLIIGILCGPFVLGLIPEESRTKLNFINEISLALIAFAASSELYLRELRSRLNSIKWITFGQLIITFLISAVVVFFLLDNISFTENLPFYTQIAISLLAGTVFVARSPASAIAIINEMRARGPFTQTVLGVTVLKDFLVIALFSVTLSISISLVNDNALSFAFLGILLLEIALSFLLGLLLGQLLKLVLSFSLSLRSKTILILLLGFLTYKLSHSVEHLSAEYLGFTFVVEPLLICIIGSFYVTNFTRYRPEFIKIINDAGPYVYVVFFTLAGASLSLDIVAEVAWIAALLFAVRLVSIMIGAWIGGNLAGDPPLFNRIGWMPYITQAGVGLGLATTIANNFPEWGYELSTLLISVIVISQIVGPPFFKWSINLVKEGHSKATTPSFDGIRTAIIFGFESQSVSLARQLQENGWEVKLATLKQNVERGEYPDIDIRTIEGISMEVLNDLDAKLSEAIVCMLTDDENYKICELAYENLGTRDLVVRLNNRQNFDKFHKVSALIVDPSTAIVSLLDHFVRSPQAASLLLGMEEGQDSMDIEIQNPDMRGLPLRDLRLPADIIILSINRGGHQLISHGYTRLRLGDYMTVVGSKASLENVALRFGIQ